jgi:hypothetical protein
VVQYLVLNWFYIHNTVDQQIPVVRHLDVNGLLLVLDCT